MLKKKSIAKGTRTFLYLVQGAWVLPFQVNPATAYMVFWLLTVDSHQGDQGSRGSNDS